jgi:transcriptional regulator with XRE-family HTH domain
MADWEAYGEEVKRLREVRSWSQAKLGALAGISQSAVRDVEAATAKNSPHADTVAGLQRAFGAQQGQDGYTLTANHVSRDRADWLAHDLDAALIALIESLPPDRRDVAIAVLRDLAADNKGLRA